MLSKRVIPCLDVHDGRTVKGINFVDLIDAGDENFVRTVLVGWSGIKDDTGSDLEFNDDNFEAILDNQFIVLGIIKAYGESMQGATEKN